MFKNSAIVRAFMASVAEDKEDRFRKALALVHIMKDCTPTQVMAMITDYRRRDLISDDEVTAMKEFYGVIQ